MAASANQEWFSEVSWRLRHGDVVHSQPRPQKPSWMQQEGTSSHVQEVSDALQPWAQGPLLFKFMDKDGLLYFETEPTDCLRESILNFV